MDKEMADKEEARLLAAINKTSKRPASISRAATKTRPTPSIIPTATVSPAKLTPTPSAYLPSPFQNFGNPSAATKSPSSQVSPSTAFAPAPSAFVRSSSQNFGSPALKNSTGASQATPSPSSSLAPTPSSFVRSPSQNFGTPVPRSPSTTSLPSSSSASSIPRSTSQQSFSLYRSPSQPAVSNGPSSTSSSPSVVKSPSAHSFTGYLPAQLHFNSPVKYVSPRPSPQTTPTSSLPPSRSSSTTSVPLSQAADPTTPRAQSLVPSGSQKDVSTPQNLQQSFQELDNILEATAKSVSSSAPATPVAASSATEVSELDRLISDLHKTTVSPAAAGRHTYGTQSPANQTQPTAYATQPPAQSTQTPAQSTQTPAQATQSPAQPTQTLAEDSAGTRPYGATFDALLAYVEKDEKSKTTTPEGEYPTPAPSSRLNNRKLTIPSRPQHEDSSDSLLERALFPESAASSPLRDGGSVEERRAERRMELTEEIAPATPEVHPAFQSTYHSINSMLDGSAPSTNAPVQTTSTSVPVQDSVVTSATLTTHSFSNPMTNPASVVTSSPISDASHSSTPIASTNTTTTSTIQPTYTTSSFTSPSSITTTPVAISRTQLDSVEPMLAALEQRQIQDVPRTPTAGPTPAIAPITDSSREIRTALEVYQPESVCAGCNQTIQGRHLLALDKHWHNEHLQCVLCFTPITQYAAHNEKPYCGTCYTKNFLAPRCNGCGDFIVHELVDALGGQYHVSCFVCSGCHSRFPDGVYVESKLTKGQVYCQPCFYRSEGKKCNACGEPITETAYQKEEGEEGEGGGGEEEK